MKVVDNQYGISITLMLCVRDQDNVNFTSCLQNDWTRENLIMTKGIHILLDCYDVPHEVCLNDKFLLEVAAKAATAGGATIINSIRYRFGHDSPPGCTVIIMLDESHISLHTYAEEGIMAIDIFACGKAEPELIFKRLSLDLGLVNFKRQDIVRF